MLAKSGQINQSCRRALCCQGSTIKGPMYQVVCRCTSKHWQPVKTSNSDGVRFFLSPQQSNSDRHSILRSEMAGLGHSGRRRPSTPLFEPKQGVKSHPLTVYSILLQHSVEEKKQPVSTTLSFLISNSSSSSSSIRSSILLLKTPIVCNCKENSCY